MFGQIAVVITRQALENGVVLAVDGQQRRATGSHRIHKDLPGHDQGFLVGQQNFFPGTSGGQRGAQTGCAHNGRHHAIDFRRSGNLLQRFHAAQHFGVQPGSRQARAQISGSSFVQQHGIARLELLALLEQQVDLTMRGQGKDAIALRMAGHHIQRAFADAAGGTEYGQILHTFNPVFASE